MYVALTNEIFFEHLPMCAIDVEALLHVVETQHTRVDKPRKQLVDVANLDLIQLITFCALSWFSLEQKINN